jgi:hypothetical protein
MILWVESQDTEVIALLVFGLCYALAALLFLAAAIVSRRRLALELKATSPVMLTPLGIVAGLLIAFLASRVWANLDHAHAYVAAEATAIQEAVLLADARPPADRSAVRGALRTYLHAVQAEDWPAMAEGRASVQPLPPGLTAALGALLSFAPATPGQQVAQQRAVIAVEQILDARRNRIMLSNTAIASIQWRVIAILVALIMMTVAMVHIDRIVTMGVNLFIISTAVAACRVLLMVHDRPFAAGGSNVPADAYREVGVD